jgi:hypothetical protein
MSSPESDSTVKGVLSARETFQGISFDDGSLGSFMDVSTARVESFGLKACDESELATLGLFAQSDLDAATQGGLLEFSTCEEINLDSVEFAQASDGITKTGNFKIWKNDEMGGFILGQFEDDVATRSDIFDFETCEEMHLIDKEVLSLPPLSLATSTLRAPRTSSMMTTFSRCAWISVDSNA